MIELLKKHKIKIIISSIITLLPIIAGLLLFDKLPENLPIHWNAKGEVDGYAPKLFAIITMPIFLTFINLVGIFATLSDKRQSKQNKKMLSIVFWLCPVISIVVSAAMLGGALGVTFNAIKLLPIILGILFFFIGNYMPKCRYNHTIGIRIPTTLKSEENWDKTHYFAGKVWVICSVLIILSALLPEDKVMFAFMPLALIMALAPMIYSLIISKK